jgi:hypothetical protein
MNSKTKIVDEKTEARRLLGNSSFVIPSNFVIRVSSF